MCVCAYVVYAYAISVWCVCVEGVGYMCVYVVYAYTISMVCVCVCCICVCYKRVGCVCVCCVCVCYKHVVCVCVCVEGVGYMCVYVMYAYTISMWCVCICCVCVYYKRVVCVCVCVWCECAGADTPRREAPHEAQGLRAGPCTVSSPLLIPPAPCMRV